jgi:hypothetical protein
MPWTSLPPPLDDIVTGEARFGQKVNPGGPNAVAGF